MRTETGPAFLRDDCELIEVVVTESGEGWCGVDAPGGYRRGDASLVFESKAEGYRAVANDEAPAAANKLHQVFQRLNRSPAAIATASENMPAESIRTALAATVTNTLLNKADPELRDGLAASVSDWAERVSRVATAHTAGPGRTEPSTPAGDVDDHTAGVSREATAHNAQPGHADGGGTSAGDVDDHVAGPARTDQPDDHVAGPGVADGIAGLGITNPPATAEGETAERPAA